MFVLLLVLSLSASLLVCVLTILLFWRPLQTTLAGRVSETAAVVWTRFLALAVCVIGVSFGLHPWELERYVRGDELLSSNLLALEIYKSLILTGQAAVAALAVVFVGIGIASAMKQPEAPPSMSEGKR